MAEFTIGMAYTRRDLYEQLSVPADKRDGAWNRGYREWEGEMFIFATVGTGTTSGFDYPNTLQADGSLTWTGVKTSHTGQDQIRAILKRTLPTHVFARHSDRGSFVYLGIPTSADLLDDRPARMRLGFGSKPRPRTPRVETFQEGASRDVVQSRRERDKNARAACLEHWGSSCVVCGLDSPWNHVHHLYPVAEGEREVNPVTDLRPLCPTCHGMVHWFKPLLTIEEAQHLWATEFARVSG